MEDHVEILRKRIEKAEQKVSRYEKSLETAGTELADLRTALRVIEGLANDSEGNGGGTATTLDRQHYIVQLLGVGRGNAQAPAELFQSYRLISDEDITIDTFRTTIWRMKGRTLVVNGDKWAVFGEDGLYWKDASHSNNQPTNENEPPTGNASGGSETGEVTASPNESRQGNLVG